MVDVQRRYPEIRDIGGEVAAVLMGSPVQVANYRKSLGIEYPCLCDTAREAYRAYGLDAGSLGQVARPSIWAAGLKALLIGGIGWPTGDVRQMPGSFIVDTNGEIQFAHRAKTSADYPPLDEILAHLRRLK